MPAYNVSDKSPKLCPGDKTSNKFGAYSIFEKFTESLFISSSFIALLSLVFITVFIFYKGIPGIFEIGFFDFLFGMEWKPGQELFGIFPMIVASIYATIGAILLGVPIGILTAIFLAEIAPEWFVKILRPAVELLAGIPSVVYGFFGLIVFVPIIHDFTSSAGNSLLAVVIILSIMILPTIINISEVTIKAVPSEYKEGSLALGATQIQTIFKVMLPAAKSGILAAVVLGIGRAIGETMAVILVAGNTPAIPTSILDSVRTMTTNIVMEMNYAFGTHEQALFSTAVILFTFILILNIAFNSLFHKKGV